MSQQREKTPEETCTMCAARPIGDPKWSPISCRHILKHESRIIGKCSECDRDLCTSCYHYATRNMRAPVKQN